VSRRLEIHHKATVTATKTRKRRVAGRRRSGGGGLGFGFGVPGWRRSGGDLAVAARGHRGGGDLEEEPGRRRSGGVSAARSSRRSGPVGGSAYQETDGCCTAAHSRWLPFIGDEIRDC
jgi:hypothetical protein